MKVITLREVHTILDAKRLSGEPRFDPLARPRGRAARNLQWKAMQAERRPFVALTARRAAAARARITRRVVEEVGRSIPQFAPLVLERVIREEGTRILTDFLQETAEQVGMHFGQITVRRLRSKSSWALREVKQFEDEWMNFVREWLRREGGREIRRISSTLRSDIMEIIIRGREEGLSGDELAALIDEEMEEINRRRARLIGRTETITVSNLASLEGARRTGVDVLKEWLDSNDSRVRDSHEVTDGQRRELDAEFDVTGSPAQYPADPKLPPKKRINCRCTIIYVPRTITL